jgi:hypothetical protein
MPPALPPTRAPWSATRTGFRLHARINTESIAIAGPDYEEYHTFGFDAICSIT